MLFSWFRDRFLSGTFFRDLLLLLFVPSRLIQSITLDDQADFNRSIDFVWNSIKYSILIAIIASFISTITLNQTVWYVVRIFNFLLAGFLICLLLPRLGETRAKWDNVLHIFSYPAGVMITASTLLSAGVLYVISLRSGKEGAGEVTPEFALQKLFAFGEPQIYAVWILPLIAVSCALFFARTLRLKRGVPIWKSLLTVALALPIVMALTLAILSLELALLGGHAGG